VAGGTNQRGTIPLVQLAESRNSATVGFFSGMDAAQSRLRPSPIDHGAS